MPGKESAEKVVVVSDEPRSSSFTSFMSMGTMLHIGSELLIATALTLYFSKQLNAVKEENMNLQKKIDELVKSNAILENNMNIIAHKLGLISENNQPKIEEPAVEKSVAEKHVAEKSVAVEEVVAKAEGKKKHSKRAKKRDVKKEPVEEVENVEEEEEEIIDDVDDELSLIANTRGKKE